MAQPEDIKALKLRAVTAEEKVATLTRELEQAQAKASQLESQLLKASAAWRTVSRILG